LGGYRRHLETVFKNSCERKREERKTSLPFDRKPTTRKQLAYRRVSDLRVEKA